MKIVPKIFKLSNKNVRSVKQKCSNYFPFSVVLRTGTRSARGGHRRTAKFAKESALKRAVKFH